LKNLIKDLRIVMRSKGLDDFIGEDIEPEIKEPVQ
jgi:hypothetical protein